MSKLINISELSKMLNLMTLKQKNQQIMFLHIGKKNSKNKPKKLIKEDIIHLNNRKIKFIKFLLKNKGIYYGSKKNVKLK